VVETYQKNAKGLQLYKRSWPIDQPQAVMALFHGQGEHIGRYDHVAAWFNAQGIAVFGMDHQGHGKSDGSRGHAANLQVLLDDIQAHVTELRAAYPDTPLFVYAHSMGGQLLLNTALRGMLDNLNVRGLITTGPWIRLAFEAPAIKILAGKLLKSILPGLTMPTGLTAKYVSRDPAEVQKYLNDPLNHGKVSAAGGMALLEGADYLNKYRGNIPFPMLIMHGTADKLTSQPASKEFADRLVGDVTYRAWDGLYHEIHNEKERELVFQAVLEWININV
jgi:alpha-beta hydrolase superfamily lysophospholipase